MNVFDILSSFASLNTNVTFDSFAKLKLLQSAAYVSKHDDDYFVVDHNDKFFACILASSLDDTSHDLLICDAFDDVRDAIACVDKQFRIDVLSSREEDERERASAIYTLNKQERITIYSMQHMKEDSTYKCDRNAHAFVLTLANCKYRACLFSARENEFVRVLSVTDHEYLSEAIAALSIAQERNFSRNIVELHDFDLNADFFEFTIRALDSEVAFYHARFDYETKHITALHCNVSDLELARCEERACNDMHFLALALERASTLAFAACE